MTNWSPFLLIIDVESTCWETKEEASANTSEIIEIGYALVDYNSQEICENNSIYVIPTVSKISSFCTNLTGITEDRLATCAVSFSDAIAYLKNKFKLKELYWGSWGNYDRKMFVNQCSRESVSYPFSDSHFNIKAWHRIKFGYEKEVGMVEALKMRDLTLVGTHHSAQWDSYNIANLVVDMLRTNIL